MKPPTIISGVTVKEASELLDVSPRRVRKLIADGLLIAASTGRDLLVDIDSLHAEMARRKE